MKYSKLSIITMMISSLLLIATLSVQAADVTITDIIDDVSSVDYFTEETTVVTTSPYINVQNIDIVKATYSQVEAEATVTLQVRGTIENRGKIIDFYTDDTFGPLNFVEYDFTITTSEQDYTISYANETGQVNNGLENTNLTSADFTVAGDTLTIHFPLTSASEVYDNMTVTSMFVKMNFTATGDDISDFTYLSDIAPNPALEIMEAYAPNVAAVGDSVQFNGSIIPLTGQPPYQYHWDFGDGKSSTDMNPTHTYSQAGDYTYMFTVTDQAGDSVNETGSITISTEGGSSDGGSGLSDNMILFLAVLAIIIIIGVVVIIYIIRR
jgi:PKD repeat protein